MEAKLSVEIGADVSKLTKVMATASRVVSTEAGKIDKSTITLQKNLNNLNKTKFTFGSNFVRENNKLITSLAKSDAAVKKSKFNYVELGRVLQDAPFGLIGIQNNLTQLIPSVGLAGLAFSALISALTFSQVGFDNWTRGLDKGKKSTEDIAKANEEFATSLSSVNQAFLIGRQEASKEIVSLETLYNATQNTSLSIKDRTIAVKELQDKFPDYFGNIKTESILNGNAKDSYDDLTKSITAAAIARAAEDKVVEITKQQIVNLTKRNKLQEDQIKLENDLNNVTGSNERASSLAISEVDAKRLAIQKQLIPIQGKLISLSNDEQELAKERAELLKIVNDLTNEYGVKTVHSLKNVEASYKRINTEVLDIEKIIREENAQREKGLKLITAYLEKVSGIKNVADNLANNVKPIEIPFTFTGGDGSTILSNRLDQFLEDVEKFNDDATKIISNGTANIFADMAAALGDGLASGVDITKALGGALLSGIGDIATQLGRAAIGIGIGMMAIKKSFSNPLTAIAAGVALVAIGAAIKSTSNIVSGQDKQTSSYQVPKFANGVTNFSGGTALVGERGPELVTLPTGSNVITNENIRRYGSNSANKMELFGEFRIVGNDLVATVDKANKSRNRIT